MRASRVRCHACVHAKAAAPRTPPRLGRPAPSPLPSLLACSASRAGSPARTQIWSAHLRSDATCRRRPAARVAGDPSCRSRAETVNSERSRAGAGAGGLVERKRMGWWSAATNPLATVRPWQWAVAAQPSPAQPIPNIHANYWCHLPSQSRGMSTRSGRRLRDPSFSTLFPHSCAHVRLLQLLLPPFFIE